MGKCHGSVEMLRTKTYEIVFAWEWVDRSFHLLLFRHACAYNDCCHCKRRLWPANLVRKSHACHGCFWSWGNARWTINWISGRQKGVVACMSSKCSPNDHNVRSHIRFSYSFWVFMASVLYVLPLGNIRQCSKHPCVWNAWLRIWR